MGHSRLTGRHRVLLLFIHVVYGLFYDPNRFVQPIAIVGELLQFNARKPSPGILRRAAQWFEMPGSNEYG
jgi:hypothetical protein